MAGNGNREFTVIRKGISETMHQPFDNGWLSDRATRMLTSVDCEGDYKGIVNGPAVALTCKGYIKEENVVYQEGREYVSNLRYANIKKFDISNGPGIRLSLFVSGCERHCPGCFNSEIWDRKSGKPFDELERLKFISELTKEEYSGVSILGGEPLEIYNIHNVGIFCSDIKEIFGDKRNIWVYSGYKWEEIPHKEKYLKDVDVLVDGPFVEELKDPSLAFRGSSNQRIILVQESLHDGKIVLLEDYM